MIFKTKIVTGGNLLGIHFHAVWSHNATLKQPRHSAVDKVAAYNLCLLVVSDQYHLFAFVGTEFSRWLFELLSVEFLQGIHNHGGTSIVLHPALVFVGRR